MKATVTRDGPSMRGTLYAVWVGDSHPTRSADKWVSCGGPEFFGSMKPGYFERAFGFDLEPGDHCEVELALTRKA